MGTKTNLIKKTSKTFLITGLVLAILSSVVLYFYTKNLLQEEIEEALYSTEARIVERMTKGEAHYDLPPIIEILNVEGLRKDILKDTIIYDPSQDEMEVFRELSTFKTINNKNYQITVRDMIVETEDILSAIVFSYIVIIVLAFLFLYYFNTARNIKLWRPFFINLEQMKSFSLTSNHKLELVESDILEFSELKVEIETLTNKVRSDYLNLKQFTENVSHELQTPLAIIQAKIDNIINEKSINDTQFEQITSIQKDIHRLKQLNKRVTILSKIDNNQFANIENVNLTNLFKEKIGSFKEMEIDNITHLITNELIVPMDAFLADILINNLISNAIKHSDKNDEISIITTSNTLVVSNKGKQAIGHPERIFNRFYTENTSTESTGLGLAIVKRICDFYKFDLGYEYKDFKHSFSVSFH
ncbi:sensor histidine kinase [Lacinutrix iliipiscaria]|uniref:histidine kinase n=1 Tax=Lacinutrix iliipiscaria TaxID=1230532 RepID=A0ABW5WPD7_9FLAO